MAQRAVVQETREKSAHGEPQDGPEIQSSKRAWQKPILKDISAEIMAQPYIRFT